MEQETELNYPRCPHCGEELDSWTETRRLSIQYDTDLTELDRYSCEEAELSCPRCGGGISIQLIRDIFKADDKLDECPWGPTD